MTTVVQLRPVAVGISDEVETTMWLAASYCLRDSRSPKRLSR